MSRPRHEIQFTVPPGRTCIECWAQTGDEEPASWTVYDPNMPEDEFYFCHYHVRQYREAS